MRHGDVLIRMVEGQSVDGRGRVLADRVIARGEVTGHAHRVVGEATVYEAAADRLLIDVTGTAEVVHEEHRTITLGPGLYEVVGQREYTAGDARRVTD